MTDFTHRIATINDLDRLHTLIRRAIDRLQSGFLDPDQVRASHRVMGLDTQLLHDGTYFMLFDGDALVGCGGWSYRKTLFGGDTSLVAREPETLDPATDPARIRAMYTDPDHARRGIGRAILDLCEHAARSHGFRDAEMMATLAGEPLYHACGYRRLCDPIAVPSDGTIVPLVRMGKALSRAE
ncbi:GNAT family N-acetyltransferase [Sphingomonas prati]|uniref:GNAT superfamily N-acetyltransferase n=1 Tax=Sphingomonas prati TaxID=1843237 RepID=A0A7W9BT66_9SPHN|nr:GNAT family N-acetyltransferase [Sphingomonas prati]MBB5729673.1 GNAT superfamily N-acetyltransferase [Sphingomonas prati]GGE90350.1 acetyltransferase [Sphingomonas prati]